MGFDIILKSVSAEGLVWKTKFCQGYLGQDLCTLLIYELMIFGCTQRGVVCACGVHEGKVIYESQVYQCFGNCNEKCYDLSTLGSCVWAIEIYTEQVYG